MSQSENQLDRRVWAISAVLTVVPALFAAWHYPSLADLLPAMSILPAWMAAAAILTVIGVYGGMMRKRVSCPTATLIDMIRRNWTRLVEVTLLVALAGINLIAFMWMKPLLNQLVPFWADPLLANADRALFLGQDPWTLLSWANVPFAGVIYHPVWFFSIAIALLVAAFAPASPQRSAIIASYFVLWSLVAPVIHSLLPAAGPIFYEAMGYGPRFSEMQHNPETLAVSQYLWNFYSSGSFGAGNGISAMPSMHVTTSSWVVIAALVLRRDLLPLAILGWLVIFTLSIALGWHYALDGIVGAFAAFATYSLLVRFFGGVPAANAIDTVKARPVTIGS